MLPCYILQTYPVVDSPQTTTYAHICGVGVVRPAKQSCIARDMPLAPGDFCLMELQAGLGCDLHEEEQRLMEISRGGVGPNRP
jgi:hypothetical protein